MSNDAQGGSAAPASYHGACRCAETFRDGTVPLLLPHLHGCPGFYPAIRELIGGLVRGLESWAADEDGIHPEAWTWYERAKLALGEPVPADRP